MKSGGQKLKQEANKFRRRKKPSKKFDIKSSNRQSKLKKENELSSRNARESRQKNELT